MTPARARHRKEVIMTIHPIAATAVLATLLAAAPLGGAGAQLRPDPAQRPEPAPQTAPGNPNPAPPEKVAPEDSGGSGVPLGERLARSHGTIKPPAGIDPGMATPAPDPGPRSMPVIPPPGTPGGDSTIVPK
jgi:hypothetical protein